MKKEQTERLSYKYVSIAVISGAVLWAIVLLTEAFSSDMPLDITTFFLFHTENLLVGIVEFIIVLMIVLSYFIGRFVGTERETSKKLIEKQQSSIEKILAFAEKLRDGSIDTEYEIQGAQDTLGKTLVELRDQLEKNRIEEELRKKEENQRHWVAAGVAQFSDILRHNMDDIRSLAKEVVSNLVNYMDVNQASFYNIIEEDNERYFELIAIYAFGRDKYPDQRIAWGEGLVGACSLEKETIYLTEIPDSYITITSGLGQSNPRSLLIVPLQYNEEVHGVIELASFKYFEDYQIRFVERIAENIASTLAGVKTNEQTARLLKESQLVANKMAEQEEFMLQNMKELEATQMEAAKQSEEFISFSNSVNLSMLRAEFDLDGNLIYSNDKFNSSLELTISPDKTIHITHLVDKRKLEWFERYWIELISKSTNFDGEIPFISSSYNQVWTVAAFASVTNLEGKLERVLFLGLDVTSKKNTEQQNSVLLEAINNSTLKLEFNLEGAVLTANERFMKLLRFSSEELRNFTIDSISLDDHKRSFKTIWQNISRGIPYEGRVSMTNKNGNQSWFHGTFSLIASAGVNAPEKVIFFASDITHQVEIEEKSKIQNKKLIEQEELLRASREDLSRKLREAKEEMRSQYKEIELVKALNEKTLEGTLDAIISINQFSKIEFFNEAAEELWGVDKSQVLGKHIEHILPKEHETDTEEEYMGKYLRISDKPILGQRTEVFFINQLGQRDSVLLTLAEAKEGEHYRLTGFIQKVELELF